MSGYIDWESQPSLFKHYPGFLYRIGFDAHPSLEPLAAIRYITFEADLGGKPYYRLNTPSAGNLHPVELYVQIRGVKGVLSGIYHVDAAAGELVLLRETGSQGLEPLLGLTNRFDGFLFLLSVVPYRSEWKYGHRAWRYCYMDAGHQIGALYAALDANRMAPEPLAVPERAELNRMMGFDGDEFFCAAYALGTEGDKPVKPLKGPLMRVAPTDYCESDGTVPEWLAQTPVGCRPVSCLTTRAGLQEQQSRRSARAFSGNAMENTAFEHILHMLGQPPEGMTVYTVILRPGNAAPGLYRNDALLKTGEFAEEMVPLLVDQRFIASAEIVTIFCSKSYDADLQMAAAAFAHSAALDAAAEGVGFTAIGAFYDKKVQAFLGTADKILYVGVFGMER